MVEKFLPRKSFKKNLPWNLQTLDTPFFIKIVAVILLIGIAVSFKMLLSHYTDEGVYFIFFTVVVLSVWFFGRRAGIIATLLSALIIDFYFVPPLYNLSITNVGQLTVFSLFIFEGLVASKLISRIKHELQQSEIQRLLVVQNEKRFRLMVEGVKDYAIFFLNPDGFIVNWNEGAQRLTKYTNTEAIGKHFSIFFDNDAVKARKPWIELEQSKLHGAFEDENWRIRRDGTKFFAHTSVSPIFDNYGTLEGYVKIMRDITERKAQEQQKDNFISIASHELKTPITSIKAFTQLMQKQLEDSPDKKLKLYLSRMDSQIKRLTKLVEDLLDVSRISQGRMEYNEEVFKFSELIDEIVGDIQPITTKHKLIKKGKANVLVLADKYRVGQVLINLLTNAIKYSPDADKIIIKTTIQKEGILVAVQDYGIGIPSAQHNKVFERFYRVLDKKRESYPGLGLGLYISSEIMKRHGGKMWFESHEGKGSTFYFLLPITLREKLIKEDLKGS